MKKTVFIACAALFSASLIAAQSADEIVDASRNRIKADTTSIRARLLIAAKDGSTTERLVDEYSKDYPSGDKAIIVFQSPASVKGTRFLTVEKEGPDDRWIFLPALGKVRRVSASEGSSSFVGTDFSYDDMAAMTRSVSDDAHRILREEKAEGKDCWVIESAPKDASYQYARMLQWIEKDTKLIRKIEGYDKKGNLAKVLEVLKTEVVQGRLTAMSTRMTTVADKTSTTINMEIVKYDEKIPDAVFTTEYLSTGRVK